MLAPKETLTIDPLPCSNIDLATRREKSPDAVEVERKNPIPLLVGPLGDRSRCGTAGTVDQNIDPTEALERVGDEPLAGLGGS